MTPDESKRVAEIEAREKAATEGPWDIETNEGYLEQKEQWTMGTQGRVESLMGNDRYYPWVPKRREDWQFIAHSRADIPYLLDLVKRQAEELKHMTYLRPCHKCDGCGPRLSLPNCPLESICESCQEKAVEEYAESLKQ